MIFKRKDVKAHGTSKMIEGNYEKGDRCLIVDDVITSGISIIETVEVNKNFNLILRYQ
jgi:uridine monophosphate synthetase